jgi:hypothetical protein
MFKSICTIVHSVHASPQFLMDILLPPSISAWCQVFIYLLPYDACCPVIEVALSKGPITVGAPSHFISFHFYFSSSNRTGDNHLRYRRCP